MKVLVDTNVILDLLLDRRSFSEPATQMMARIEEGELEGFLAATTLTTIFFLSKKFKNAAYAEKELEKLLRVFEIAPVNRTVLQEALQLGFKDFEDAVLFCAAKHVAVDVIVTRNIKDFKKSTIPVFSPAQLLKSLDIFSKSNA